MKLLRITLIGLLITLYCAATAFSSNHFTIDKSKVIDANGNEFIIKGMNNPHIWFKRKAYKALDEIAALNVNTIRIVWGINGKPKDLERIIERCIDLKMIPMVELHDATGSPSLEKLMLLVAYYTRADVKQVLLNYEKYLMINIANEWGNHEVSTEHWLNCYSKAVAALRDAGYKTTIVIDGPGWGQNIQPILEAGNQLLERDSEHNLLFSIHMYGSWNDSERIKTELTKAKELELPLIVGEFGYNFNDGKNNLGCKVDHKTILETCHELGYGFMPWSWTGNNKENAWLDLSDHKNWKTLTWWGKEVFEGSHGITQTAKRASVF
jgi:mannan endo-1,4-beta-mannosidase